MGDLGCRLARASAVAAFAAALVVLISTPRVAHLRSDAPAETAFMSARRVETNRAQAASAWVELPAISPWLVCAVVKAEDRGFFQHHGFDWRQMRKAALLLLSGSPRLGGSTITQQLARNLFLDSTRSFGRKLREASIASRLESELSKSRILALYLNVIEWGDAVWGARSAARDYFGKEPDQLDLFESTFLASLIAAPRAPLRGANADRSAQVQSRILVQLWRSGAFDRAALDRTRAYSQAVRAAIARGQSLPEALRSADQLVGARSGVAPPLGLVAEACGLERELAAEMRR